MLREALLMSWAAKVSTALIAIVTGAMCAVGLLTVGQSAANERAIAAQLDQAGARKLVVRDVRDGGFINAATATLTSRLSTAERVAAFATPIDVTNGKLGPGATKVPAWQFATSPDAAIVLTRGRPAQPGEALVSEDALAPLGLAAPLGFVVAPSGAQWPVVGAFRATDAFTDLDAGVLINNPDAALTSLTVVARTASDARATQQATLGILAPADPTAVQVESPAGAADTALGVGQQLGDYGHQLLLTILSAGGLFIATVVLTDVLTRRRDLGRRRTLGISRSDLVSLVVTRALVAGSVGTFIGCMAAQAPWWKITPAPTAFVAGLAIETLLVTVIAAAPPALMAAWQDPVAVLRTP